MCPNHRTYLSDRQYILDEENSSQGLRIQLVALHEAVPPSKGYFELIVLDCVDRDLLVYCL